MRCRENGSTEIRKKADQKLLIELQQAQMNSVQETVKSEMKSWADVVKKTNVQRNAKQLTENSVKQAVRAVDEEKQRSRNLMIYGCQEKEKEAAFEITKTAKDVFDDAAVFPMPRICQTYRIGKTKKEQGKIRPIKVVLESIDEVDFVLERARNLKDSDKFKQVYLGPDRTKENHLAHNKLDRQMKQMIEKDPNKHYYIRQGRIRSVYKESSSHSQTLAGVR